MIIERDKIKLKERLAEHKIKYIDEPYIRFAGTRLEQETMFIADPYLEALQSSGAAITSGPYLE